METQTFVTLWNVMIGSERFLTEIDAFDKPISWKTSLMFFAGLIGLSAFALGSQTYLFALAAPIGLMFLLFFIRHPHIWLYSVGILLYPWFRVGDESISIFEYFSVAYFYAGLGIWFLGKVIVKREKIVQNSADFVFLSVVAFFVFNVFFANLNGTDVLSWLRESLRILLLLYYFPIRDVLRKKKHLTVFLVIIGLLIFISGLDNLNKYRMASQNALYAFEIVSKRVTLNEILFVTGSFFSLVVFLFSTSWKAKLIALPCSIFFAGVLIATFSRGYWLALLIGVASIFFFLSQKQKLMLMSVGFLSILAISFSVLFAFGQAGSLVTKMISNRLTSVSKSGKDLSLLSRINESERAFRDLMENPFGGTGLGHKISFYEPIFKEQRNTNFLHNGYVFIFTKFGLVLGFFFYYPFFFYTHRAWRLARTGLPSYEKILVIFSFGLLLGSLFVNNTSAQIENRDGIFIISLLFALISFVENQVKARQNQNVAHT